MLELLIVAAAIFAYALVSERLASSPITAPMVFTAVGLLAGSGGFGWFDLGIDSESIAILVEATLVLVLFTDAARIDLGALRGNASLPARLLGIGMPLTVVVGTLVAIAVFAELSVAEAALLAAVLAPTDAALGQAVVSNPRLPVRIRQSLNVESGLNDGIAVPMVTVLLTLSVAEEASADLGSWVRLAAEQLGFGLMAGVGIGAGCAMLLDRRARAGQVEGAYRQLAAIATAVAAYAAAELLDGNGFVAAFTAGLAFGYVAREQCAGLQDFTEDEGELLAAITFVAFGAVLAGPALDELTWQIALYAVASLTVVRILPVLVATTGSGLMLETRLFLGWFGPRGLASILFGIIVLEDLRTDAGDLIVLVTTWTVLLSIVAHGVSAVGWSERLSRELGTGPDDMAEMEPMPDLPTRRRLLWR